jgi:hypothetical protein
MNYDPFDRQDPGYIAPDDYPETYQDSANYKKRYKSFEDIGESVGKLVHDKQMAYGDSFGRSGECLRQMYPNGIKPEQYDDLLTIARILDKLFRIANDPKAFEENPYQDIVGYGLLGMSRHNSSSGK